MSLLDTASLIVTPNGYKEGKLYSVIPSDGSGDLSVVRNTDATRFNGNGLVQTMGVNIPRLDYSNGTCPSLLVEPQRTNSCLYSNDLTGWINQTANTTLTRIQTGGVTGGAFDRLVTTGSGGQGRYVQTATLPASNAIFTIYLRGTGQVSIGMYNAGQSDVTDITLTSEWTRYESAITSGTAGYMDFSVYVFGGASVDVSCAQLEFATYATSYIPTTSASVTRNADVISKTGISSLIGQTEGTLYFEAKFVNVDSFSSYIGVTSGTFTNSVIIGKEAGISPNKLFLFIRANGSDVLFNTSIALSSDYVRCAIAYKSGNWAAYVNGTLVASGTSSFSFSSSLDRLGIGTNNGGLTTVNDKSEMKAAALWKTRLTNDQLATLTTL